MLKELSKQENAKGGNVNATLGPINSKLLKEVTAKDPNTYHTSSQIDEVVRHTFTDAELTPPSYNDPVGLPEVPEYLTKCRTRFKPQLVDASTKKFTDTEVKEAFARALKCSTWQKVPTIEGVSDSLSGLSDGETIERVEHAFDRVVLWTRSLLWAYRVAGCQSFNDAEPMRRFQLKYLQLALLHQGEKVLKFHLTFLFCKWAKQFDLNSFVERECPKSERDSKPGFLLCGGYDRYLRRKLFSESERMTFSRASIAYTLIQCKRAWPPIDEQLVHDSLVKHRDTLSGISRNVDNLIVDLTVPEKGSELEKLAQQVRRTVREVLLREINPYSMKEEYGTPDKYVPSLSSHVDEETSYSRKEGGAFGRFSEQRGGFGDHKELESMTWISHLNYVHPKYGYPRETPISHYPTERVFNAQVHTVLEPAKARIITAGPPVAYTKLKPIQKRLWGIIHRHPTFQLTGGVKLSQALSQLLVPRVWNEDDVLVSADYSAATDNLHPTLIFAAADEISELLNLDPELESTYIKSLLGHVIHYPEESGLSPIVQRWGQLMGSPSSFSILCLINAAVCRYAMEQSDGRRMKLVDSPLLINGDDAGFILRQSFYQKWWDLVTLAGLEPSLGKNYVSREFIMLNSELHLARNGVFPQPAYFEFVPFVNLGLIAGQSKVLSDTRREDTHEDYDVSSTTNELVRGFSGDRADQILSWYLAKSKNKVMDCSYPNQSWFVPKQLGGLGIPLTRTRNLTRGQSKLAQYLSLVPADEYSLPAYLGVYPRRCWYLQLAIEEENQLKRFYNRYWVEHDEKPEVDLDLNYKVSFTSVSHIVERPFQYKEKCMRAWKRLWEKGTSTKLKGLSIERAQDFRSKRVGLKRPNTTPVPVDHSLKFIGITDNVGSLGLTSPEPFDSD